MRLIEIVADAGHSDTLAGIAEQHDITDYWWGAEAEDGRRAFRMLVNDQRRQVVMDAVQSLFAGSENVRVVVLPVDTVLPRSQEPAVEAQATREELFTQIERGTRIDDNFLLLTFLSTLVVAIGLIEDSVAVVIGAMVIAPLLGPFIAVAFASSLGDPDLLRKAAISAATGLGLAFAIALLIGGLWPVSLTHGHLLISSGELLLRTDVGLDSAVLALASGAAAVVSLSTGLSTTLVGVMVAVALLPPTAAFGLLLGAGHPQLALGAFLLLAVNVVSVIVAAKVVFVYRGVRPRTWIERNRARQSAALASAFWIGLLAVLLVAVIARHRLIL